MREDAIRFVEAVERWQADPLDTDRQAVSQLASELATIETASLPSGPFCRVMRQVRNIATQWRDAPRDGVNDEELFQWVCRLPFGELLERLDLHDGLQSPEPPPLTDNDSGLLETMLSMGATANAPCSGGEILRAAKWTSEGKRAFDRLKECGYVGAKKGVGFYLTKAGIKRAKKLCE